MNVMTQRGLIRQLLLAALGLAAGSMALGIAMPLEPQILPPFVALFSPGLKLAELLLPEMHKSLAWTFGWFLRIAILTNAVFYYAICALLAYWFTRRSAK